MVIQYRPQGWRVEATRFHGMNLVSYKVGIDRKRTPIIGTYLLPSTLKHLPNLEDALVCLRDQYPILIGDLRANIVKPQNLHRQQVTDLLTDFGLVDLLHHFRKNWRYKHVHMWPWERQGRSMQSSSNYILGTGRHRFQMVGIRGVSNHLSYHLVLRARLLFSPTEAGHQCNAGFILAQVVMIHSYKEDTRRYPTYAGVGV